MSYQIGRLYHPSHRVVDLRAVEEFFARVFGRYSLSREGLIMAGVLRYNPEYPDYPRDYCTFTPIADVFFDSVDPSRYVIEGEQRYPDITSSHLDGFGWGVVEGIGDLFRELRRHGIRSSDQLNVVGEGDEPPTASFNKSPLFWTLAEDTGLRYEFYPASSMGPYDPRTSPTWQLSPVIPEDPLGIERSAQHVVLTDDVDRALRLVVTILGGVVIHEGRNELLQSDSTFVLLGDDVFEYARPTAPGPARDDLDSRSEDSYHTIVWKVADIGRVRQHLSDVGVRVLTDSGTTIITDPEDGIGVPWWFTSEVVPGDPRFG